MFSKPTRDQVMALSGFYQACQLVEAMARSGWAPEQSMETAVNSLFVQDPENTEEVFGGLENLQEALGSFRKILGSNIGQQGSEIFRYMMGVNYLATKLERRRDLLGVIDKRLKEINLQRQHFTTLHETIVGNLADLYVETVGSMQRRIQVHGHAENLQQPLIAAKIRCLLFAAIRSAILWRQLGGKKIHLLLHRKSILALTTQLISR